MALLKYYFTVNPGKILPLHYLSTYDGFLEYAFGRKAVLGRNRADRHQNGSDSALLDQKTAGVGAVTALEPKIRIATQSVFYAMCTRNGTCASGCGVSQTHIAEIVFGIEIVEWDLCPACLSRTGFLEYINSLPSATPREAEEIGKLLGNFD